MPRSSKTLLSLSIAILALVLVTSTAKAQWFQCNAQTFECFTVGGSGFVRCTEYEWGCTLEGPCGVTQLAPRTEFSPEGTRFATDSDTLNQRARSTRSLVAADPKPVEAQYLRDCNGFIIRRNYGSRRAAQLRQKAAILTL